MVYWVWKRNRSGPQDRHPIGGKDSIMGHDDDILCLGLSDEHAIKRITVMQRQVARNQRMLGRDRQFNKIVGGDRLDAAG
jgi:hypothetical protein